MVRVDERKSGDLKTRKIEHAAVHATAYFLWTLETWQKYVI